MDTGRAGSETRLARTGRQVAEHRVRRRRLGKGGGSSPMSVFANTGQDCCARSRMFVERPHLRSICGEIRRRNQESWWWAIRPKPKRSSARWCRPRQRDTVEEYLGGCPKVQHGIRLRWRPSAPQRLLPSPTVLLGVDKKTAAGAKRSLARSCASRRSTTRREMMREVNASPYGLSGSIWTNDLRRALRVARAGRERRVERQLPQQRPRRSALWRLQTKRYRPRPGHGGDGRATPKLKNVYVS